MVEIKTSFYAKYVKASSDIDSLVRRMLTNVLGHYLSNMNWKEKVLLFLLYLGLLVDKSLVSKLMKLLLQK